MNDIVLIRIYDVSYLDLIKFLIKYNIKYEKLCIYEKYTELMINNSDLYYFKLKYNSVELVKYSGFRLLLSIIKKHCIFILCMFFSLFVILLLSRVIFKINVNTSDNNIKEIIINELKDNGIVKYKFIKSDKDILNIKNKILNNNKDRIDWIEIRRVGTSYYVDVNLRKVKQLNDEEDCGDIVASKDGLIKYIYVRNGTKVKEVNEIVHKGETIISGTLLKDENIIDNMHANGKVYAETWYVVNISVPYKHVVYYKTGDVVNHIYADIFGKKITLIGKYETSNSFNTEKVLVDKPYLAFKIVNECKELYEYKTVFLSKEEAFDEAIKRSDKSILDKLRDDEYIIDKKVLKKNYLSSKIELEVFYRVYESIGEVKI